MFRSIPAALALALLVGCGSPCALPTRSGFPEAVLKGDEKASKDRIVARFMQEGWMVEKSEPHVLRFVKNLDSFAAELAFGLNPKAHLSVSMAMVQQGLQVVCRAEMTGDQTRTPHPLDSSSPGNCKIQAILDDLSK